MIKQYCQKKLNRIEVLFSNPLIYSYTSQNEFVLVINVLKGYDGMREEIENLKASPVNQHF